MATVLVPKAALESAAEAPPPTSSSSTVPLFEKGSDFRPLKCAVKQYAWGKPADSSYVARLAGAGDSSSSSDESRFAELWMGSHVSGSSSFLVTGSSTEAASSDITETKEVFLKDLVELPYLFKVLSISTALSVQCHPDPTTAARLHRERPEVYRDPRHKPEMAIALSPHFEAMCGFRPASEILHYCQTVKALNAIVSSEELSNFQRGIEDGKPDRIASSLKSIWTSLMKLDRSVYEGCIRNLLSEIDTNPVRPPPSSSSSSASSSESKSSESEGDSGSPLRENIEINELVQRLQKQYPLDIGILAVFFLNCVRIKKGDSLFLCANLAHAYLSGDCLEAMASSDNVVRAGLTPKLRDTDVLCEMLDYSKTFSSPNVTGMAMCGGRVMKKIYSCPVSEFRVELIDVDEGDHSGGDSSGVGKVMTVPLQPTIEDQPFIVLVYNGAAQILKLSDGSDSSDESAWISAKTGDVFLVRPSVKQLSLKSDPKKGVQIARCFVPPISD